MNYFITGATGFIGRFLLERIFKREGIVYVLVRESSLGKLDALREKFGVDDKRLVGVVGELSKSGLGISKADMAGLKGNIKHFFHLAAIYDIRADLESQRLANTEGTRHAMQAAEAMGAGCFHQVSSVAAAGLYPGVFREDMFEEAEGLDDPYLRTKHESEGLVRSECKIPWRIYRPSLVIGDSKTGEMDKIDGPYYFFQLIKSLRRLLPPWVPLMGIDGGKVNIVPVDYVADAMDCIAHKDGLDGGCFHLTDSEHHKMGAVINIFAAAAHAPRMTMRVDLRVFGFMPPVVGKTIGSLRPVQRISDSLLKNLGIPRELLGFTKYNTRYDSRETQKALEGSGISCPSLNSYADNIWYYWERHLDPELFIDRSLEGRIGGRVVVVTGASSGIGKAVAIKMAEAKAQVILAARTPEKLEETKEEIESSGGIAHCYRVDVSDMEDCDRFCKQVLDDFGEIEVLVNNAGRSIRRQISMSYDRFHDFERTMQLNYFGALRLTMNFLPKMEEQHRGHIINISSIGVLTNAPRFSAYVASKAALDAFSRCAASEFSDQGISFTAINMPLVRTPMIAPTKIYDNVPTISPEEAAEMVCKAIIYKPKRIATRLGLFAQILNATTPKLAEVVMNTGFRMFPDSAASKGKKEKTPKVSTEQVAFSYLMRGIYW